MRVYSEMECDLSCEDGIPCIFYSSEKNGCDFHKEQKENCDSEPKKKRWKR